MTAKRPVIGVCGEADGWSSRRLVKALEKRCQVIFFQLQDCSLELCGNSQAEISHLGEPLCAMDAVLVKKIGDVAKKGARERIEILFALKDRGTLVRSRPEAIGKALDRIRMTRLLAQAGIPIPRTLITESVDRACAFVSKHGDTVFKPALTSKGRGMHRLRANCIDEARALLSDWSCSEGEPIYLQEFQTAEHRADMGVAILDGKVIGGYSRVAPEGAWLTTIAQGGRYAPLHPDDEVRDLALRAAAPFGLTFTGVDIVRTEQGLSVYEVSAFGGFKGLWETQKLDAATLLADSVLAELG